MLSLQGLPLLAAETAGSTAAGASGNGAWWITAGVVVLLLGLLGVFNYATRAGIIARATMKEAIRQPVFFLLIFIGLMFLVLNTILPFFSLGDDIKMLKECGLMTILITGLLMAIWTSSTSIADEIEGKTAMTLLSKPINRRQFVLGKYFGILQGVLVLMIPLALVFLFLIYFKVGYDARESGRDVPAWFVWISANWLPFQMPWFEPERLSAVLQILPGLVLSFLEISVLTAVSVAISTRLPMMVNLVTCIAIFIIGHLTPVLVQTVFGGMEFVKFAAQLFATILPSLEAFNISAAVATGSVVPPAYLGFAALYAFLYGAAAILFAFILFEDRDLA